MLVARLSFTDEYDGERVAVFRGSTRVDEDHELAERWPHRFEAVAPEETLLGMSLTRDAKFRERTVTRVMPFGLGRWPWEVDGHG
jgi:hypothetical protein